MTYSISGTNVIANFAGVDDETPRVLLWTGDSWPDRPDDSRPTFWVGGDAPGDAPVDIDLVSGDVWIPESGDGGAIGATATLDFPSVAAQSAQNLTITVTGAVVGDCVAPGIPAAAVATGLMFTMYVSAADVVTVRAHNYTTSAINPPSGSFKAMVIR